MAHLRMHHEMLDQIERRPVQPLQIVEEQRQGMLGPSEHPEEPTEHQLEAILAVLRREIGYRRLLADDEGELRDQIDHEPAIGADRFQQAVAPAAQLRILLAEQLANQALEGLSQRRIGNVALVLVELAAGKETPGRDQQLVKLADDRGFADAGIARYQHELRRALVDDAIEGRDESLDLALAPIELLRDQQLLRPVLGAQREGIDAAPAFPCAQAPPQIGLEAGRRLVAVLARLGEQLHDDPRDGAGMPPTRSSGGIGCRAM